MRVEAALPAAMQAHSGEMQSTSGRPAHMPHAPGALRGIDGKEIAQAADIEMCEDGCAQEAQDAALLAGDQLEQKQAAVWNAAVALSTGIAASGILRAHFEEDEHANAEQAAAYESATTTTAVADLPAIVPVRSADMLAVPDAATMAVAHGHQPADQGQDWKSILKRKRAQKSHGLKQPVTLQR